MIELGSGWASGEFSKHYNVWSVEHNARWIGKYDTNYIHAPIIDGWYSTEALKEHLPKDYGLILVDGPPGSIGRGKFFDNIDLFKTDVIIIFDDVQRDPEYNLMVKVANHLDRTIEIHECGDKKFGVVLLDKKEASGTP